MSAGTLIRFFASILLALAPVAARAGEPAPRGDAPCSGRIAEKLGVRFVEVCGGNQQDSFWISVAPMPCSAGEHETIACPSVTPLLTSKTPVSLASRRVALVDGFTAHRLCALRFAGQIATRAQLERAREELGLAAVVVSERDAPATAPKLHFEPLPEWTAEGRCDNPSVPGAECRFSRWPGADARNAPMAEIRACDARRAGPDDAARVRLGLGGNCPASDGTADGDPADARRLPCTIAPARSSVNAADDAGFVLACHAPGAAPARAPADEGAELAGFRCVVPTWSLATFE